jgi:hypothetical protein
MMYFFYSFSSKTLSELDPDPAAYPDPDSLEMLDPDPYLNPDPQHRLSHCTVQSVEKRSLDPTYPSSI